MPKIIIKEYDKTSAGTGPYSNFAVLVPGYVSEDTDSSIFDENGICEFSNQAKFVQAVGKVSAKAGVTKAATAAVPTVVVPDKKVFAKSEITEEQWVAWRDANRLFSATPHDYGYSYIGYLRDDEYIYKAVEKDEPYEETTPEIEPVEDEPEEPTSENTSENGENSGEFGGENTGENNENNEEPTEEEPTEEEPEPEPYVQMYAVIDIGNYGNDREEADQYGNQIAYELLGLGYTVLYKLLTNNEDLTKETYWEACKDKSIYDFRYVVNGVYKNCHAANEAIIKLAHAYNNSENQGGRGDCIALIDIPGEIYEGKTQAAAVTAIGEEASSITGSQYAAVFAPYVTYGIAEDAEFGNNRTFPGYFHYLACASKAFDIYSEWYAVAGYTRGISNYSITALGCKFGEAAIDALEPRYIKDGVKVAVNLIITMKGAYYLWGNRTALTLGQKDVEELRAGHFLNIRQLCSTIKKQVYVTCRKYTFDPNSDVLWAKFCADIRPTLERMKSDQGITDYRFVKVKTNQKAILKAKIRIVPIEAVEDFDISLTLEDSVSGITAGIDEE